ncbi:MAG: hypothetical protein JSV03_05580, partial [Planctomycetota bacterium]
MNSQKGYILNVVVTGFMVLVILSTALFLGRFCCLQALFELMPPDMAQAVQSPSGLLGDWDREQKWSQDEPNAISSPSRVELGTSSTVMGSLGFVDVVFPDIVWEQLISQDIFWVSGKREDSLWDLIYFDDKLDLLVKCSLARQGRRTRTSWTRNIELYAGPEGMSKELTDEIGTFTDPLISQRLILFDRRLSRFIRFDFKNQEVIRGPEVEQKIIKVGRLTKNGRAVRGPYWQPPKRRIAKIRKRYTVLPQSVPRYEPVIEDTGTGVLRDSELALDNSGYIYKVDMETLELTGPIGSLPWPGAFGLLAYNVEPFMIGREYKGLMTGGIGPDVFRPKLFVFGQDAGFIGWERGDVEISKFGGGPGLSIANFILETLHPLALELVSYFAGIRFNGTGGYRSIFVLPHSLVGRIGAQQSQEGIVEYILGLWVVFP